MAFELFPLQAYCSACSSAAATEQRMQPLGAEWLKVCMMIRKPSFFPDPSAAGTNHFIKITSVVLAARDPSYPFFPPIRLASREPQRQYAAMPLTGPPNNIMPATPLLVMIARDDILPWRRWSAPPHRSPPRSVNIRPSASSCGRLHRLLLLPID